MESVELLYMKSSEVVFVITFVYKEGEKKKRNEARHTLTSLRFSFTFKLHVSKCGMTFVMYCIFL